MIINKEQNLKSFRKALTIPFIICMLTLIPDIKGTFEWYELKFVDFLFSYYPEIFKFTQTPPNSSTIVITKDQSFQTKNSRSPNRSDYAKLLHKLKNNGVKVAAFDFIFDEANKPEDDEVFIKELGEFPYPVIAHNFVGRGTHNFGIVNTEDSKSNNYSSIESLYQPIAEKVVSRGLININSDLDSVIRYAPLAYRLSGSDYFLPTLGFSTWVVSLLSEMEIPLNNLDLSRCKYLEEAFKTVNTHAPYEFNTTGHEGLDRAVRRIEAFFLYKFLIKKYPNLNPNDSEYLRNILRLQNNKEGNTWVKLPEDPLPIIGEYDTPCLRLPFQKLSYPLIGDAIESVSMTRLITTEEDENSAYLFSKNELLISAEEPFQKIKPVKPQQVSGQNSISGEIKRLNGEAINKASVWAIMPKSGYWEKAKIDPNGQYRIENLPSGEYVLNVFVPTENGCDKALMRVKVQEKETKLPLLLFPNNNNKLEIPSAIIPSTNEFDLWIYGESIALINSDNEGKTSIKNIPEGFYFAELDDEEDDDEGNNANSENIENGELSLDETGTLLVNNKPLPNKTVALLPIDEETNDDARPDEKNWQIHFYRRIKLQKNQNNIIDCLPPSLSATINVTSKSSLFTRQNNQEINIIPGKQNQINKLPRASFNMDTNINLKVSFMDNSSDSKIILLSHSGKEYEITNEMDKNIPSDNYIVLTQSGDFRGLHKEEVIDKKTVFIGTSLPTDQDFIVSPINFLDKRFSKMPGVFIHANLFDSLSKCRFMYSPPFYLDRAPMAWPFLQFLLIFPVLIILNSRLKSAKTTQNTFIIIIVMLFIALSATLLFSQRILIPVVYPCFLIASFGITRGFMEWINFRKLANETQNAFSRFISADVVSQIVNNPNAIKPGGEKKELTIMFTDIAGFTSISEKLDAEALTELMNNYLDEMTKILFKNGGTLDKYVGDAIMGFWNHPTEQEDHATRAVTCAIEMQKKLKEMRENWIAQGLPKVEMRAGINSGNCMVGFIGSKIQMNFTCLGDNVNLASRLEGANKAYGTFIMVSESVKQHLNPYIFSIRFLDFLAVKGKNKPVLVYEVRGWLDEETPVWKEKAGKIYEDGIEKYLGRKWDEAISLFKEVLELVPDDSPSKVYIERCEHFKLNPPDEKWDGHFVMKTK